MRISRGRSRHGHNVQQIVCSACAAELPAQLHGTLYKMPNTDIYLCETHQIVSGWRPPTPDFGRAMVKAQEKLHAERASGVSVR